MSDIYENGQISVAKVLKSDIAVPTLLKRLKGNVISIRELAIYFKKRIVIEEEYHKQLSKAAIQAGEVAKRSDTNFKSGTFCTGYLKSLKLEQQLASNADQLRSTIVEIHDELQEEAKKFDGERKIQKEQGLRQEKQLTDLEAILLKTRAKYDSVMADVHRISALKAGDDPNNNAANNSTNRKTSFGIPIKPKSNTQVLKQEDEIRARADVLYAELKAKTDGAFDYRKDLERNLRPQTVSKLCNLIQESDAFITVQLQRFGKLVVKRCFDDAVKAAPMAEEDANKGYEGVYAAIDNGHDFDQFINAAVTGKAIVRMPVSYDQPQYDFIAPPGKFDGPSQYGQQQQNEQKQPLNQDSFTPTSAFAPNDFKTINPPYMQDNSSRPMSHYQNNNNSLSHNINQPVPVSPISSSQHHLPQQPLYPPNNQSNFQNRTASPQPLHPSHPTHAPHASQSDFSRQPQFQPSMQNGNHFGKDLATMCEQDKSAVPHYVRLCTELIETYGLSSEGIYRISVTARETDLFREFYNQVLDQNRSRWNSGAPRLMDGSIAEMWKRLPATDDNMAKVVASVLKEFFRHLSDPVLTLERQTQFLEAASIPHEDTRYRAIHEIINGLPDANYATLRHIVFHLLKVASHEPENHMGINGLSIVWGPNVLNGQAFDLQVQIQLVEVILSRANEIFEPDM